MLSGFSAQRLDSFHTLFSTGLLVLAIAFYLQPWIIQIPDNVDDIWYLSSYYNYHVFGENKISSVFGYGNGTLPFFGKTLIPLITTWFDFFEWSKTGIVIWSRTWVLLGGVFWFFNFRHLFHSTSTAFLLTSILIISESVFYAGHLIRPESFAVFIFGLTIYLLIKQRIFTSFLIAWVTVEIHLFAFFIGFFNLCLYVYLYQPDKKTIFKKIIPASLFALAYFVSLHINELPLFFHNIHESTQLSKGFLFTTYFQLYTLSTDGIFNLNYQRLVELAIIVFSFAYLIKTSGRNKYYWITLLLFLITFNFINPKNSPHYLVYFMPVFVFMFGKTLQKLPHFQFGLYVLFAAQMPMMWYMFSKYDSLSEFERKVESNTQFFDSQLPKGNHQVIIGAPVYWYSLKNKNFHASVYTGTIQHELVTESNIFVIEDSYLNIPPIEDYQSEKFKQWIQAYPFQIIYPVYDLGEFHRVK